MRVEWLDRGMKDASVIETPLIGSGSQEEADKRVVILLEMGTSRGFLTYEELNEKLPDEVVSPDKLDTLLMRIDEMGIKLIDEFDVAEYTTKGKRGAAAAAQPAPTPALPVVPVVAHGRRAANSVKPVRDDGGE